MSILLNNNINNNNNNNNNNINNINNNNKESIFNFSSLNDIDNKTILEEKTIEIGYHNYPFISDEYFNKLSLLNCKKIIITSSSDNFSNFIRLPNNINYINFYCMFRKNIFENEIPNGVKKVILSEYFNDTIKYIPDSVIDLTIGNSFNKPFNKGDLNNNLRHLSIGNPLKLVIQSYKYLIERDVLPNNLISLYIGDGFETNLKPGVLPHSIKKLTIKKYNYPLQPNVIPPNVEYLDLSSFNYPLKYGDLPNKIKYLNLYFYDHELKEGIIPCSVEYLDLTNFKKSLKKGDLPIHLIKLKLSNYLNDIDTEILPNKLKYLNLYPNFSSKIMKKALPNTLTHLLLGINFNQTLEKDILPDSLIYLRIGDFNDFLYNNNNNIPSNLIELSCNTNSSFLSNDLIKRIPIISIHNGVSYYYIKYIYNKKYNININYYDLDNMYSIILDIICNGTKGSIIFKELLQKVLDPKRLDKLSILYNIDVDEFLNNY